MRQFSILQGLEVLFTRIFITCATHQVLSRPQPSFLLNISMTKYLPDKAIDVIDEAGALSRLSGKAGAHTISTAEIEKIVAKIAKNPPRLSLSQTSKS